MKSNVLFIGVTGSRVKRFARSTSLTRLLSIRVRLIDEANRAYPATLFYIIFLSYSRILVISGENV